jgi:hypothetical protein
VPFSCNFMYEIGISFYRRDFFLFWNKRECVGVTIVMNGVHLLSLVHFVISMLHCIREYILSQEQLSPVSIDFQTDSRFLAVGGRGSNMNL